MIPRPNSEAPVGFIKKTSTTTTTTPTLSLPLPPPLPLPQGLPFTFLTPPLAPTSQTLPNCEPVPFPRLHLFNRGASREEAPEIRVYCVERFYIGGTIVLASAQAGDCPDYRSRMRTSHCHAHACGPAHRPAPAQCSSLASAHRTPPPSLRFSRFINSSPTPRFRRVTGVLQS